MKLRNGFVSNSSTSSFMIYGCEVTDKLREAVEGKEGEKGELYELAEEAGLCYHTETEYGDVIGLSYADMGEDETPRQFKAKVVEELEKFFGRKVGKCELMRGEYPS